MKAEIYISNYAARLQAKRDFAKLLGIQPASVRVSIDVYNQIRHNTTKCSCGETKMLNFRMSNLGPRQAKKLLESNTSEILRYGVCRECGKI